MAGRRRRRGADRRLAALVLALTAAVAIFAASGACCISSTRPAPDFAIPRELAGAPVMRVALAHALTAARAVVEVRGPYKIYASDARDARPSFAGEALPAAELSVEPGGAGLVFGQYVFRPPVVRIVPERPGTLVVDGAAYRGELVARPAPDLRGLALVNRVNLEEYTAGVLGGEMPLAFPEAALRAQAIASRTYGLHASRARPGEAWDVLDDTSSQVYKGLAGESDVTRKVTLDTLGVILTYRGQVFRSYFHSTCGGETISNRAVFGEAEIPPLAGAPCGFCEASDHYRWRAEVKRADLLAKLQKEGAPLRALDRLDILEMGPAGRAATVRVSGQGAAFKLEATKLRAIVGARVLQSTAFSVEDAGGPVVAFAGRGWGHGVGMCQWGARGMAKAGYDGTAILRRYYPAAELVKVYSGSGGNDGRP
jgi:stage II sporulation protein D